MIPRKTFLIAFFTLCLSILIAYFTLYKLCGLLFPPPITGILVLSCLGVFWYSFFVIYIKRFHDLNKSGWWSLLTLIAPLNLPLLIYLAVAKGKSKNYNKPSKKPTEEPDDHGGIDTMEYKDPYKRLLNETKMNNNDELFVEEDNLSEEKKASQLLSTKNGLIALAVLLILFVFTKWKEKHHISNDPKGMENIQKVLKILPESAQKEIMKNKRSMGGFFVDDQFITVGGPISKDRVLVRGVQFKNTLQRALSQNKKVEIRFLDNSSANITKFIVSNDALSVQMAVFQIDKAIGTPGHLGDRNKKILQDMNAF